MEKLTTIDGSKLKKISDSSESAHELINHLGHRLRFRRFTDITRLKCILMNEGKKIVEEDYMETWKAFEKEGYGSIIYGRKGKPDRFEWFYNLKSIGKAGVSGEDEDIIPFPAKPASASPIQKAVVLKAGQPDKEGRRNNFQTTRIFIPIRQDFNLDFTIPENITKNELDTIKNILQRLAS